MRILFVDDYPCSKQNGIGTFRDIFVSAISAYDGVNVTLVSLNTDVDETVEINSLNCDEFQIPRYNNGDWRCSGARIASELKIRIADASDNIFILNYSPCADFIAQLKKTYPLSKWVFIIHDQGWCSPLLGDKNLLSKIIHGVTPAIVSDSTANFVKDYYSWEIEIYDQVDKVVCLSDSMQQILLQIYNLSEHKIAKVENGLSRIRRLGRPLSKERVRTMLGIPNSAKVIIYAGRPVRNKGLDALLIAVKNLRQKYPDLRCVIAGDVSQIINRWNVYRECAANIIMPGFMPKSELVKWYAAADAGVMVSYSEQCSFAALEMMDSGLLIVSSDGIGLRDMFAEEINSFVAHIGNVIKVRRYAKRISIAIEAALNSTSSQRKRYISYNHRLLGTKYSAATMADKYIKIFRSLIAAEDS